MKIKNVFLIIIIISFFGIANSQTFPPDRYRVEFTDKNNNPFSISNPLAYLSQKSINRRAKQSILIDSRDIPITPLYIDSIQKLGGVVQCLSKWLNSIVVYATDSTIIKKIKNLSFVKKVTTIGYKVNKKELSTTRGKTIQNSVNVFSQSTNDRGYNYGPSYNQINMLGGDMLHDSGFRGQGLTIAILDAGFIDVNQLHIFDSLNLNNQIQGAWNFVDGNNNVYQRSDHGTCVLSTMGGLLPGYLIGTAPKANYYLLITEDVNSEYEVEEDYWAAGIEYADSVGADVVNSSLGYFTFDQPAISHTYSQMDGKTAWATRAANAGVNKGMIVVVSAGNSGPGYIGTPADADSTMTIAAVDSFGIYSNFSSVGPNAANHLKPTVASQGSYSVVTNLNNGIQRSSGTSFSTPIIAGMTACLWQAFPNNNNLSIIKAIEQSANKYTNPDTLLGFGIPNFAQAKIILNGINIIPSKESKILNVFPNPFKDYLRFIYYSLDSQSVNVYLYDQLGKQVYAKNYYFKPNGYYEIEVDSVKNLAKGFYTLKVVDSNNAYTKKVVKY